jgi:hypothetical protein
VAAPSPTDFATYAGYALGGAFAVGKLYTKAAKLISEYGDALKRISEGKGAKADDEATDRLIKHWERLTADAETDKDRYARRCEAVEAFLRHYAEPWMYKAHQDLLDKFEMYPAPPKFVPQRDRTDEARREDPQA